ncbi:hypothetical protein LZ30DRAFT_187981 [Colletotrichum cereale]|nr:hypothetical protein LZ30DRAFT_187981 [Colletotrichum cereale]
MPLTLTMRTSVQFISHPSPASALGASTLCYQRRANTATSEERQAPDPCLENRNLTVSGINWEVTSLEGHTGRYSGGRYRRGSLGSSCIINVLGELRIGRSTGLYGVLYRLRFSRESELACPYRYLPTSTRRCVTFCGPALRVLVVLCCSFRRLRSYLWRSWCVFVGGARGKLREEW